MLLIISSNNNSSSNNMINNIIVQRGLAVSKTRATKYNIVNDISVLSHKTWTCILRAAPVLQEHVHPQPSECNKAQVASSLGGMKEGRHEVRGGEGETRGTGCKREDRLEGENTLLTIGRKTLALDFCKSKSRELSWCIITLQFMYDKTTNVINMIDMCVCLSLYIIYHISYIYIYICIYIYIYMYVHTYVHTHTYTYIHT